MKKMICMFLALFMLIPMFSGCAQRNTENLYGDTENRKALRICIDVSGSHDERDKQIQLDEFMLSLKETGGLESVVFEIIPDVGVERSTAISRIRTEIMAGGGPDVFIVDCGYAEEYEAPLFPLPEKTMENGLFLPLDDYMENNTEFTEWDKQQPVVLSAGRNDEGQQIIPLSYALLVQTCSKDIFSMELRDEPISWQDTLSDPELAPVYAEFNDCTDFGWAYNPSTEESGTVESTPLYFEYILGKLADFETEELLFTEEELLERVEEVLELHETNNYEDENIFTEQNVGCNTANSLLPTTMLPLYSDDGGIAVTIKNFAAVSRNTKHPEEAYRVIDVLLRSHTQLTKKLYTDGLCHYGDPDLRSIPLYEEAFHKDAPFRYKYFQDESYETLTKIKEQITVANFRSSLSYDLNELIFRCKHAEELGETIEGNVHATYERMQRKVRE